MPSNIPQDEMIERFQSMVSSTERLSVSEFARSREWRDKLPDVGCFEVTDRNGVVGYLLDPEYARILSKRISELEEQEERMQIAAMFDARSSRTNMKTGDELKAAALEYLDSNIDAMMESIDAD